MIPLQSKNSRCLCESGKKYKRCCLLKSQSEAPSDEEIVEFNDSFQKFFRSSVNWEAVVEEFGEDQINEVFNRIRKRSSFRSDWENEMMSLQ